MSKRIKISVGINRPTGENIPLKFAWDGQRFIFDKKIEFSGGSDVGLADWTPPDKGLLAHWYRGDDIITSGSNVTTVNDRVGTFDLNASSLNPTFLTDGTVNQQVISFDGAGQWIGRSFNVSEVFFDITQPKGFFIIFRNDGGNASRQLLELYDGPGSFKLGISNQANLSNLFFGASLPDMPQRVATFNTSAIWGSLVINFDGVARGATGSWSVWYNNASIAHALSGTNIGNFFNTRLGFPGIGGSFMSFHGLVGEFGWYDQQFTPEDRTNLAGYITRRYNIMQA